MPLMTDAECTDLSEGIFVFKTADIGFMLSIEYVPFRSLRKLTLHRLLLLSAPLKLGGGWLSFLGDLLLCSSTGFWLDSIADTLRKIFCKVVIPNDSLSGRTSNLIGSICFSGLLFSLSVLWEKCKQIYEWVFLKISLLSQIYFEDLPSRRRSSWSSWCGVQDFVVECDVLRFKFSFFEKWITVWKIH